MAEVDLPLRFGPELQLLGQGGFGTVYRTIDQLTGRPAAIKVPFRAAGDDLRRALTAELEAGARLRHPNVVEMLDAGVDGDGRPWLAMDCADAGSMSRWKDDVPPAWPELSRIADGVLRGLAAIHARGLVHRDIKPGNVLLAVGDDGSLVPRIADLGLARVRRDDATRTSQAAGTLLYMPPEAFDPAATRVHRGVDLYAFGVLLWTLTAAAPPWTGRDLSLIIQKSRGELQPYAPRDGWDAPAGLGALLERLLATDPESRPSTAGEVRRRLACLEGSCPAPDAPTVAAPCSPAIAGVREPRFVGRVNARETLEDACVRGAEGPVGLAVTGPAGVGVSRLCRDACADLEGDGRGRVLHLRLTGGRGTAADVAAALAGFAGLERRTGLDLRVRLSRWLDARADEFGEEETAALAPVLEAGERGAGAAARLAAVLRFVDADRGDGLGVIRIEEAANVGEEGRALAADLLRHARAAGIPILVLHEGAGEAPDGFDELRLDPLSDDETAAIAADLLPADHEPAALVRQARGIPRVVVEAARLATVPPALASAPVRAGLDDSTFAPPRSEPKSTLSLPRVARARAEAFVHRAADPEAGALLLSLLAILPSPCADAVLKAAFTRAAPERRLSPALDAARLAGLVAPVGPNAVRLADGALTEAVMERLAARGDGPALRGLVADGLLEGDGAFRGHAALLLLEADRTAEAVPLLRAEAERLLHHDVARSRLLFDRAVAAAEPIPELAADLARARLGAARAARNAGAPGDAEALLDAMSGDLPGAVRAEQMEVRASVHLVRAQLDRAEETSREAVVTFTHLGDAAGQARAGSLLGDALFLRGRASEAVPVLRAARDRSRTAGARRDELNIAWRLGRAERVAGLPEEAASTLSGVRDSAAKAGEIGVEAVAQRELGDLALVEGRLEDAEVAYRAALRLLEAGGSRSETAATRLSVGELARARGDLRGARREYSVALGITQAFGLRDQSAALVNLAVTELAMDRPASARRRLDALDALLPRGEAHWLRAFVEGIRLDVLASEARWEDAEETLPALAEPPPDPDLLALIERAADRADAAGEAALAVDARAAALALARRLGRDDAVARLMAHLGGGA